MRTAKTEYAEKEYTGMRENDMRETVCEKNRLREPVSLAAPAMSSIIVRILS